MFGRIRNSENLEYSWHKKTLRGEDRKASRIDFALISGGVDQYVEIIQYLSSIMTDHRAVYFVLDLCQIERGSGYWKLNTLLLQNKDYIDYMNDELDKAINSMTQKSPIEKWESIKARIKKATLRYSRNKAGLDKLLLAQLSEKVNEYEAHFPLPEVEDKLYEQTKHDLEDKVLEKVCGTMFRSKARWYEHGERNTKYFYALEKSKYNFKTCYKLIDESQKEISNPQQILDIQKQFYTELYDVDSDVSFSLRNTYQVLVPPDIRDQQNQQITITDIEKAIKGMSNQKTPGEDGIPIDFYKVFWSKIRGEFMTMMNQVYTEGLLHPSARKGILNLIPKANRDTRYV